MRLGRMVAEHPRPTCKGTLNLNKALRPHRELVLPRALFAVWRIAEKRLRCRRARVAGECGNGRNISSAVDRDAPVIRD
jgi:hypothetical protein